MTRTPSSASSARGLNLFAKRALVIAISDALIFAPGASWADSTPATGATQVYRAPNGVEVVDIATTNAQGLSHNKFTTYNVEQRGQVLNNGNISQMARQSELAGQVLYNRNLQQEAAVILNEVVAPNRSSLNGYIEILGGSADLVIANPYGITCSGCGFINTPNVTLATGQPQINGGLLSGFQVNGGDILITGAGLDASKPDYLSLVARSIRIDGQLNAQELSLAAGANQWDYSSRAVTGAASASGDVPGYAIDSSALGGMYANRIRLKATEAGVGVRMLGEAAASADDFSIDAAGKIQLQNKVSAERDIQLTSTSSESDAINASDAALTARRNLGLTADSGGISLQGGLLVAGNDINLSADTLSDAASNSGMDDNNQRYAAGELNFAITSAASLNGTSWGSADAFIGSFGSLQIGADGATLYSDDTLSLTTTDGNLSLGDAAIRSRGNLSLDADGQLSTTDGASQGIASDSGDITLRAGSGLDNAGTVSASDGNLTVRASGSNSNSGTLYAGSDIDIADRDGNRSQSFSNSGTLLAAEQLTLGASSITNTGDIQGTHGSSVTAGSLTNSGVLIGAAGSGDSASFNLDSLNNSGTLQSGGDLNLSVRNTLGNSGKLLAGEDLTVRALNSGTTLALSNQSGAFIQAGGLLDIAGTSGGSNLNISTQEGTLLGNSLNFNLNNLSNSGTVQGTTGGTVTLAGSLTNASGAKLLLGTSSGNGSVTAASINNSGTLQSQGNLSLTSNGLTNNSSGQLLSGGNMTVRGRSAGTFNFSNAARVQAGGLLDIKGFGAGSGVNVSTTAANAVYRGNTVDINANNVSLANNSGLTSQGNMTLNANALSLAGSGSYIVAANGGAGTGTITVGSGFTNNGAVHSGGSLDFSATSINNTGTGGFSALDDLTVRATAGDFSNSGALYAGDLLTASSTGTFSNVGTLSGALGTLDAGRMDLTASTFINNSAINTFGNIDITATTFRNEVLGGDTRAWGDYTARSTEETGHMSKGYNGCGCVDQTQRWYYKDTWSRDQYYAGGTPGYKPQIISGGTLTIDGFDNAYNTGGVISANVVRLVGSNGSAHFYNNALALHREYYYETYQHYIEYIAAGPLTYVDDPHYNSSGTVLDRTTELSNIGAGIYANSLQGDNFGLSNIGSTFAPDVDSTSKSGAGSTGLSSATSSTSGSGGISFGGITISLPSNPNGYFVLSQDPDAKYLVETNPRFAVGSDFVGSNYLAERLGYNPDDIQRRLGDAAYETTLVRQQLIQQTGTNLINGYASEKQQMQSLFDAAASQSGKLGLQFGKPLTAEQQASLGQDMVWMVETVVNGKKVLAPVVYLSQATRDSIETGAVIAANDVKLNVSSLDNTGGTIAGKNTLDVTSKGDITNTSGNIKGGDLSLKSTEGSIVNKTFASTSGTGNEISTTVGKTAGISATGNLNLDASQDIRNQGANMAAGGDASLKAGNNITFDTVANTNAHAGQHTEADGTFVTTTEKTAQQIRSGLTVGGNLNADAGKDITLRGTDATVGGDAALKAGENVNIVAAYDTKETTSQSQRSGLGVGGGVFGTEKTTTEGYDKTASGSSLKVGGNTSVEAGKTMTVEGSSVDTGGNLDIKADDVKVLAAQNEHRSTTTTETTTILPMSTSSEGSSGASAGASAQAGGVEASAEASAQASAENSSSVTFAKSETTTTRQTDITHTGSSLKSGGNMSINANKDITLQGSSAEAGGDVDLKAKDIKVLTSEDVHTTTTNRTTTTVGIFSDSSASAEAGAQAGASGSDANASASASASAEAENETTIGARVQQQDSYTLDTQNNASSIKSGGNMNIKADNQLTVKGSDIEAGGDANIEAKDMAFLAADDKHLSSTTTKTTTAGLVVDGKAKAEASAEVGADAKKLEAGANAKAEAGAEVGVGVGVKHQDETEVEGSTTARVSTIKSGGNMTRTAEGKITDVGTQIEAGGDFSQSADEIESKAAANTSFSSSSSTTHKAKVGLYAEASASAEANASAEGGVGLGGPTGSTDASASADAGASAGVRAQYSYDQSSSSESSSQAVTSSIKAGGSVSSSSKGKTSLEGTQIAAGQDVNLEAGSLDYKAARDTRTSSTDSTSAGGEVKVGVDATKAVTGSLSGSYEGGQSQSSESTAVTGGISAGGNVKIKTKDDARFEGTNIEAGGDAAVDAGGNVKFDAARNTSSSSESSQNASASLSASKSSTGEKDMGFEAEGGASSSSASSSEAVVGSIKSGGKLSVSAGKDASFEGTNLEAGGDASVKAGGDVNFNAAKSTSSSEDWNVSASASIGQDEQGLEAEGGYSRSKETTSQAGSLKSGGNLKVEAGRDVTLEGTEVEAQGKAGINAGRDVNVKAAENTSESIGVEASLSLSNKKGGGSDKGADAGQGGQDKTNSNSNNNSNSRNAGGAGQDQAGAGEEEAPGGSSAGLGVSVEGGTSTQRSGASIKGGQVDISAGRNADFEGTQINSEGDTRIAAVGDVNFKTADSSHVEGAIGVKAGEGGAMINQAEIGGGVDKAGASIQSGGNLDISSGGKTSFTATQASAEGQATVQAAGGVEQNTAVSGGAELGVTKADVDLKVETTSISGKGGTVVQSGSQFKASVEIPAQLPPGKQVEAKTADGKALPSWLSFDAKTGSFTGTPPADFKGSVNVVVKVPQADGSVKSVPVTFEAK